MDRLLMGLCSDPIMAFHSSVMADHELFGVVVDAPAAQKRNVF